MNKKITLMAMLTLFFSALVFAGNMEVSSANYSPGPAIPGSTITLWAHLKNSSNTDAKNAVFELRLKANDSGTEFPFYLDTADAGIKELGTILANQTALVKYNIRVDPQALDGTYTIYLGTGENGKIDKKTPYNIRVLVRKPTLSIVSATPTNAEIGKTFELELNLKNTGSSNAYNISVGLSEDRTVTSTGVVVERNIIPLGAATSNIQFIGVNENSQIKIPLIINPDVDSKAYYVPVKIEFYDDNKTKYTQTEYIGLKVASSAETGASITDIKPLLSAGQKSTITVEIFNTGIGTAKYMRVKAKTDFASLKQQEFFIGSLESDDSDSIKLEAEISKSVPTGEHFVELTISYKNQFGDETTAVKKIPVKVYTAQEIASDSNSGLSLPIMGLAILAVAGTAYWFFAVRKKEEQ